MSLYVNVCMCILRRRAGSVSFLLGGYGCVFFSGGLPRTTGTQALTGVVPGEAHHDGHAGLGAVYI